MSFLPRNRTRDAYRQRLLSWGLMSLLALVCMSTPAVADLSKISKDLYPQLVPSNNAMIDVIVQTKNSLNSVPVVGSNVNMVTRKQYSNLSSYLISVQANQLDDLSNDSN